MSLEPRALSHEPRALSHEPWAMSHEHLTINNRLINEAFEIEVLEVCWPIFNDNIQNGVSQDGNRINVLQVALVTRSLNCLTCEKIDFYVFQD